MKKHSRVQGPATLAMACASLLLVAYHVRYLVLTNYAEVAARTVWIDVLYFLSGLGHQAFGVYFVVQGYLLATSVRRLPDCRGLFLLKAASTYALLLPVLLVGLVLDGAGAHLLNQSGLYTAFPDFSVLSLDAATLLWQLLLAQPLALPTFGSNGVLWVLAFEWWYSCLFLLLVALLKRRRRAGQVLQVAVALALLCGFPSEFVNWGLIWLMGVAAAQPRLPAPPRRLALLVCVLALVLSRYLEAQAELLNGPAGLAFSFIKDGSFALGFAWLLQAWRSGVGGLAPSFSSAIFFGHFPVMMIIVALGARWQPLKQQPGAGALLWFLLATLAVYAVGWGLYVLVRRALAPPP